MLRKIAKYFYNRRIEKERKLFTRLYELEDECVTLCIRKENYLSENEYMNKESIENTYKDYERALGRCIGSTLILLGYDEDSIQHYSDQLRDRVTYRVEKHLGREMLFK